MISGGKCKCWPIIKVLVYLAWVAAILFWISNLFMDGGNILGMSEQHLLTEIVIFTLLALGCGQLCNMNCRNGKCEPDNH